MSMLLSSSRVAIHHVKVKPRCAVLTMLKRLDKIRFRGPRTRDDLSDLAESPPASDNECSDDMQLKPKAALRETEELLRDPVSTRPTLLRDDGNVCVCVCVFELHCLVPSVETEGVVTPSVSSYAYWKPVSQAGWKITHKPLGTYPDTLLLLLL